MGYLDEGHLGIDWNADGRVSPVDDLITQDELCSEDHFSAGSAKGVEASGRIMTGCLVTAGVVFALFFILAVGASCFSSLL